LNTTELTYAFVQTVADTDFDFFRMPQTKTTFDAVKKFVSKFYHWLDWRMEGLEQYAIISA